MNRAMERLGHRVDEIWADNLGRRIQHGNLHYVLELPRTYRREVRKAWESRRYDVVELNQPHAYLAAIDHQRAKRPGVFVNRSHGHETRVEEILRPWRQKLRIPQNHGLKGIASSAIQTLLERQWKVISQVADGFVVSCSEDAGFLQQRYHVAAERIGLIPQGVPETFLEQPVTEMSGERLKRLLYVGQFAFVKAPSVIAESISRILQDHVDANMTWVCAKEHHATARELLSCQVRNRVEFLPWRSQQELISILDSHGVFLFPSYFEGFGKAPLEAMSRGLIVIASAVGGMKDFITHEKSGFLIPPGRADLIADCAAQVMRSETLARHISNVARVKASEYTWDRCAEACVEFYRRLLHRKSASPSRSAMQHSSLTGDNTAFYPPVERQS
jgi:glycosyltransferase involved in cell wall biosynthesis